MEHLRTAAHVWAEYLDQEQKVEEIFTDFDEDHNGSLDLSELRKFVESYLKTCPPKILQSITASFQSPSEQVDIVVRFIINECDDLGNNVIEKPEMVKALVIV